MKQTN